MLKAGNAFIQYPVSPPKSGFPLRYNKHSGVVFLCDLISLSVFLANFIDNLVTSQIVAGI